MTTETKGDTKAPFVARVDTDPELADLQTRSFKLPAVVDNASGWGPAAVPPSLFFSGVPYAPFSKGDRLGRIADFTQTSGANKFQGATTAAAPSTTAAATATAAGARAGSTRGPAAAANSAFAYRHEEDEESFSVVDNKPKQQKGFGSRRKFRGGATGGASGGSEAGWSTQGAGRGGRSSRGTFGGRGGRGGGRGGRNAWGANQWGEAPVVIRDPSCPITEDWKEVDEIEFTELSDETYAPLEVENLVEAGGVLAYNPGFDHLVPKTAKALQRFANLQHFTATTSEDPILSRLIKEGAGNIYATDTILAVLMTSAKSVNSWDIIVRREGGNTYLDKRPSSRIDFLSVNENWNEITINEKESINSSESLANEATYINHNFSQQVLVKDKEMKFDEENPFLGSLSKGQVAAAEGYRYRKWQLGDKINLVARCTVNAYQPTTSEDRLFLSVRALNEFDSKLSGSVDWRQKLEAQTGAVLATEMKNNANKLSRWVAEAVLAGSSEIRLGFVTRTNASDPNKHSVLMVKSYSPLSFAKLLDIKVRNQWGSLKYILETLHKLDDGKYVLMKDPNKAALRLYQVPASFVDAEPTPAAR